MEEVLMHKEDRHFVRQTLRQYFQSKSVMHCSWSVVSLRIYFRDLSKLVQDLCDVLDDPIKHILFHYICQLLPEEDRAEFDRLSSVAISNSQSTT